ncbi:YgiW/YdeI family stress tolerance OB fold protein [Desulfobulbus sp.]|uniref:YgiW/YdeI family stress tolerance OB fold protein n=1 Tax=Desulfobulbus sp. TaxID=895 RepID=UPI002852A5DD|nr:YgiW/YdeI family stress tolerance OB fold protein [Desulfobulbus sp.]
MTETQLPSTESRVPTLLPFVSVVLAFGFLVGGSSLFAAQPGQQGGFSGNNKQAVGGFTGPGPALSTVDQAQNLRDDVPVSLRGNIIQHIGGDTYLFKDDSGTIRVDIDHDIWNGQIIGPTDTVKIDGEVDKDWNSVEIDVKRLIKQ